MLERPKDDETRRRERQLRSGPYVILGATALVGLAYCVLYRDRREWVEFFERALPFFGAVLGAGLYAVGLICVQVKKHYRFSEWAVTSVGIVFLVLWFGLVYFFT
jgi:hypothetical protein